MSQESHRVKILSTQDVAAKLRRMAYEIYEQNYDRERLVIVGIGKRGGYIGTQLKKILVEISPLSISYFSALKNEDDAPILEAGAPQMIPGQVVLIVDDVLYSGLTLLHILTEVMKHKPHRVQNAVLIDRGHRNVPVSHDFVGIELATSLQQYVTVEVTDEEAEAYLF